MKNFICILVGISGLTFLILSNLRMNQYEAKFTIIERAQRRMDMSIMILKALEANPTNGISRTTNIVKAILNTK